MNWELYQNDSVKLLYFLVNGEFDNIIMLVEDMTIDCK